MSTFEGYKTMLNYLAQKKEDKNWNAFQTQRRQTLRRDGKRCLVCNERSNLTAHHIVHKCKGGTNNNINLMTVCLHCHRNIHEKLGSVILSGMDPLKYKEKLLEIRC
jgi:5-methylcytosine-specific restriction endonuclease McrA